MDLFELFNEITDNQLINKTENKTESKEENMKVDPYEIKDELKNQICAGCISAKWKGEQCPFHGEPIFANTIEKKCLSCEQMINPAYDFQYCSECYKKLSMTFKKPLKLNLGSNEKKIYGFINIDAREEVKPDRVDDVFKLETFEPETVDLIYASHVLEHADFKEAKQALQRWFTLLKPNGILRLAVPDIEKVCAAVLYLKDMTYLKSAFWGSQRHAFDYHKSGWTFETLKENLLSVGFSDVYRYDWKKTEHSHVDDYSQAYLPHMDKENGQLISLNVEARKIYANNFKVEIK